MLVYVEFANINMEWTGFEDFSLGINRQKNNTLNKILKHEISS